jgi:hypothetical protein
MKMNRLRILGTFLLAAFMAMLPGLAYATATLIASQTPKGPYPATAPGAGSLALTFTAADVSNGNSFTMTGHEVVIVYNSDASPHTVTFTSVADQRGRSGDITAYSVAATTFAWFNFRAGSEGWQQTDGTMHLTASDTTVKFAILNIP